MVGWWVQREAVMRWLGLVLVVLVGCGSSVESEHADAVGAVGAGGNTGDSGSSANTGQGIVTVAVGVGGATGAGGQGATSTASTGTGVAGAATCVDPDPPWTCRPNDLTPICPQLMPTPCDPNWDSGWCPDDVGRCPQKQCVTWEVNMTTGECRIGTTTSGPHMCGPGNTWGCQLTDPGPQGLGWSCCVDGGF